MAWKLGTIITDTAHYMDKTAIQTDEIDSLCASYRASPINYIQTCPGRLGASIQATSSPLVEVREAAFNAGVLLAIEDPFPRFAVGVSLAGQSQVQGSLLSDSRIGYLNGNNGIIARINSVSSWVNISLDHSLLAKVAATHHYLIPRGEDSHGMPTLEKANLATTLSQVARGRIFSDLTDQQFEDEMALTILRALNPPYRKGLSRHRKHWLITQRIVEYIRAHYASALTITELCQHVGVNERTMQHYFRKSTGVSVQFYLKSYRLRCARELLVTGKVDQVKDAALLCGIPHTGRFSQYFKRMYGESPGGLL